MFNPDDMPDAIPAPADGHTSQTLKKSRHFNGFKAIADNPEELRKLRAFFHGSIKFIDDQIARIVSFLEEKGLTQDTVIVFTTDHGEMMGDHGLITKGVKHYDAGIRVPLIVWGSDVQQGVSNRLNSSLDIYPTLCDFAQATCIPPIEGKSLVPACHNQPSPQWEQVTVQSPLGDANYPVRSIITNNGFRFSIFMEENYGEMFNLTEDPQEQNNLYCNPDWTPKRLELHDRLTRAFTENRNSPISRVSMASHASQTYRFICRLHLFINGEHARVVADLLTTNMRPAPLIVIN